MASNNFGQTEQQETHLIVPLHKASQLVMAEIVKAKNLLEESESIQTQEQFDILEERYLSWREYTLDLLKRRQIFDTEELAEQFGPGFYWFGFFPRNPLTHLQNRLRSDIRSLSSLFERLPLFPKKLSQPAPPAKAGVLYQSEPPPEPKLEAPPEPKISAPVHEWFDWFHHVKDNFGYRINLNDLGTKMGLTHGYVRHLHRDYMKKRRGETTQKTTQK